MKKKYTTKVLIAVLIISFLLVMFVLVVNRESADTFKNIAPDDFGEKYENIV